MIQHFFTKEELNEIKENFHSTLDVINQFSKTGIDEERAIQQFLSGNFKIGSISDPLLDCFGEAINEYKFKNITPKRINNMMNNLPHIMEAEVVKANNAPEQTMNNLSLEGKNITIEISIKPSSKKPGRAIVSGTITKNPGRAIVDREEMSDSGQVFNFKTSIKIENLKTYIKTYQLSTEIIDSMFNFNVTFEETDESNKGIYNAAFSAIENEDAYGPYFEIEPVEAEINFAKPETISEFVQEIFASVYDYNQLLGQLNGQDVYAITIVKGGKNNIEYLSTKSPILCGNLVKLEGNMVSELTYVSSLDIKEISEHKLTDAEKSEMHYSICALHTDVVKEDVEAEDEDVEQSTDDEAPETEN